MHGKNVLVTGALGALGGAVAQAFHEQGATLVLVGRTENSAPLPRGSVYIQTDLTKAAAVAAMAQEATEQVGPIDVLVNTAGGFSMGPAFHETDESSWDFMLDLNARTLFLACRALLPSMLEAGGGKIVNVAARAGREGKAKMGPYCASKSAVISLTESLAAEYRTKGINVNCVLPGTIDTPANREAMPKARHDRWVPPEAIADVILFLASPEARAIHGAAVPVFGLS